MIESLPFTYFNYPLSAEDRSVLTYLIGPSKADTTNRRARVYTWTSATENKTYVGGTPNAGRRVRKYAAPIPPKTASGEI